MLRHGVVVGERDSRDIPGPPRAGSRFPRWRTASRTDVAPSAGYFHTATISDRHDRSLKFFTSASDIACDEDDIRYVLDVTIRP